MDFTELINSRYSVRAYKPVEIEEEKLQAILEAARMAPTACNLQPFQLIVVHTRGREEELNRIYQKKWFTDAPIIICVCAMTKQAWSRPDKSYSNVDAAIIMDHIILAATNEGLGTCWIGAFDPNAAREVLSIPEDVEPVLFTPLGYPADSPREKNRKSMNELVRYEKW